MVCQPLGQHFFCVLPHPIQHFMIPGGHPKHMQTSYQYPIVIWVVANIPSTSSSQELRKNVENQLIVEKSNYFDDSGATPKPPTSYRLGCNILLSISFPETKKHVFIESSYGYFWARLYKFVLPARSPGRAWSSGPGPGRDPKKNVFITS